MNERDESLLLSIKEECEYLLEKAETYNPDEITHNKDLQNIVTMPLVKLGEYVKSLSIELKEKNKYIEWSEIVGLRNKIVHNYDGLHMDRIWGNVTQDVPELLEQVNEILHSEKIEE
jgi:uncharacterized protein with HEPN domain